MGSWKSDLVWGLFTFVVLSFVFYTVYVVWNLIDGDWSNAYVPGFFAGLMGLLAGLKESQYRAEESDKRAREQKIWDAARKFYE